MVWDYIFHYAEIMRMLDLSKKMFAIILKHVAFENQGFIQAASLLMAS